MRNLTRTELYALELWACGLNNLEIRFALGWTQSETDNFRKERIGLLKSLKKVREAENAANPPLLARRIHSNPAS